MTISQADYEALLDRLEDAEDELAVLKSRLLELAIGRDAVLANAVTGQMLAEMQAGTHPLTVWRAQRGLTPLALAEKAGVGLAEVEAIEAGTLDGSISAFRRLAAALGVQVDDLVIG